MQNNCYNGPPGQQSNGANQVGHPPHDVGAFPPQPLPHQQSNYFVGGPSLNMTGSGPTTPNSVLAAQIGGGDHQHRAGMITRTSAEGPSGMQSAGPHHQPVLPSQTEHVGGGGGMQRNSGFVGGGNDVRSWYQCDK